MKLDWHRAPFALVIGWGLVIVIGFPSWFIYTVWTDGYHVGAVLIATLIVSCIFFAYWALGKVK